MVRMPKRLTLPLQAAEIILEMITNGDIQDLLPGERKLASQLQIGRDTLRSALLILEGDGVISPREHGKRRKILMTAARVDSSTQRIAYLSPKRLTELPPWMMVEFDTLREFLHKQDYQLQLVSPGLFHLKNPTRKLESLIKDNDVDAWILYQCPPAVQEWFQKNKIPSLIRGSAHPGIDIPSVDEDWSASAFHAGSLLKRLGHSRIGLLRPETKLVGLTATEEGLRKACPPTDDLDPIVPMIEKGTPENIAMVVERSLRLAHPPTAIVTTRSRHLLTLLTWAGQQGLQIPDHLSVVSLSSEPWFDHILPGPTHYATDPAAFARTVLRHIIPIATGQSYQSVQKLLIPEYVPGKTVSAPGK